jgi:Ca2+-binding EF-hand superfamily protein
MAIPNRIKIFEAEEPVHTGNTHQYTYLGGPVSPVYPPSADLTPLSADSRHFFTPRNIESEDEDMMHASSELNLSWRMKDKANDQYVIHLNQSPEFAGQRVHKSYSAFSPSHSEFPSRLEIRVSKRPSIESSPIGSTSRSKFSQAVEELGEGNPQRTIYERLEIPRTNSAKTDKGYEREPATAAFKGETHMMFTDSDIKEAFEAFDINGDQFIDSEEIRLMMEAIGEIVSDDEIEEMVRMLDYSGKGKVTFEEFYKMSTGQSMGPVGAALPPVPSMVFSEASSAKSNFPRNKSTRSIDSANSKVLDASKLHDIRKASSIREDQQSRTSFDLTAGMSRKSSVERPVKPSESLVDRSPRAPEEPKVKIRNLRDEMKAAPKMKFVSPIKEEETSYQDIAADDAKVSEPEISRKSSSARKDLSLTSNSSSLKLEGAETNLLVADLVQQTFFAPKTVERLIKLFVEVTGSEQGEMQYPQFIDVINSRLPDDRKLEDDRVTRRIFALLDKDLNNCLSIREFSLGISYLTRPNTEEQFQLVFRVFDADDDGLITRNELTKILKLNTASIKTDEQANKKADEILNLAGGVDSMTLEGFLQVKDKRFMLLYPVQERARKIARLLS